MSKRALALVFATALISGVSIFVNGLLVKTMTPSIFTFLKNASVAAFIIAILLATRQWRELKNLTKAQWAQLALIGLVGGSIPFLLFFKGLSMTSGTMGAFIHKTLFIYVAILAAVFLREKFHSTWFLGALCLLIGNAVFLKVDLHSFSVPHLLILIATILWAIENTISKHVLDMLSGNVVIFGRMFFGALFMVVYLLFTGELSALPGTFTLGNLAAVAITSVFLLGYVLTWYHGIQRLPVSTAACILLLGSPITTLLSAIFLEQTVTLPQIQGMGLLALGVLFVMVSYRKTRGQLVLSTA